MASPSLNDFIAAEAIALGDFVSFVEASEAAGRLLVNSGLVVDGYVSEIIEIIQNQGPYMVIAPGVAIVHGRPSESVLKTGGSMVIDASGVISGNEKNDPVRVILAISAKDDEEHLQMLKTIAELFNQPEMIEKLANCSSSGEVLNLISTNLQ